MRKIFFLAFVGFILLGCTSEKKKLLTSRIEYDIRIDKTSNLLWASSEKELFLNGIIQTLYDGKGRDENDMPVSTRDVVQLLKKNVSLDFQEDSLQLFLRSHIAFLRFREKWEYDAKTFYLYKRVVAIAPGIILPAPIDTVRATSDIWLPLWWISAEKMKSKADLTLSFFPTYTYVRNDVDEVLDTYESLTPWFCQLPRNARDSFYLRLLHAFEEKKFTFYNMMFQPFSNAEYDHYFLLKKTLESDSAVQNIFHPSFFARIKFIERWEISFSPFAFRKTVLAFAPSQVVFDPQYDIVKGYKPLFWVVQDTSILKNAPEHEYWF